MSDVTRSYHDVGEIGKSKWLLEPVCRTNAVDKNGGRGGTQATFQPRQSKHFFFWGGHVPWILVLPLDATDRPVMRDITRFVPESREAAKPKWRSPGRNYPQDTRVFSVRKKKIGRKKSNSGHRTGYRTLKRSAEAGKREGGCRVTVGGWHPHDDRDRWISPRTAPYLNGPPVFQASLRSLAKALPSRVNGRAQPVGCHGSGQVVEIDQRPRRARGARERHRPLRHPVGKRTPHPTSTKHPLFFNSSQFYSSKLLRLAAAC